MSRWVPDWCGATDWKHDCRLPRGHHGRHVCMTGGGGCGHSWPNENETRPCPSTQVAVLGIVGEPALVRCGLLLDHDGPHRMGIEWETS